MNDNSLLLRPLVLIPLLPAIMALAQENHPCVKAELLIATDTGATVNYVNNCNRPVAGIAASLSHGAFRSPVVRYFDYAIGEAYRNGSSTSSVGFLVPGSSRRDEIAFAGNVTVPGRLVTAPDLALTAYVLDDGTFWRSQPSSLTLLVLAWQHAQDELLRIHVSLIRACGPNADLQALSSLKLKDTLELAHADRERKKLRGRSIARLYSGHVQSLHLRNAGNVSGYQSTVCRYVAATSDTLRQLLSELGKETQQ